jgi:hypothetical protein
MQIRKKGMKLKKKSSLKLLSQSQPNFAEMILSKLDRIISAKFGCDWLSSFRVEDFVNFFAPFF